jgi:hypothetical protein
MQIDIFPAYANQKVGAMIMAIAVYNGAPTGVQQLSLSFFSEEVLDEFIREIGAYISPSQIDKSTGKTTVRVYPDYANLDKGAMVMSLANHVYGQHLVGIQQLSFHFPSQEAANTFTEEIDRYFGIVDGFFTIQESASASAPIIESNESEHENSK